jgi:hypothetical protein
MNFKKKGGYQKDKKEKYLAAFSRRDTAMELTAA